MGNGTETYQTGNLSKNLRATNHEPQAMNYEL